MIIELRGAAFTNKGAHLMLLAVVDQLSHWQGEYQVAARMDVGNFQQRSKAGLYHLLLRGNRSKKTWLQSLVVDPVLRLIPHDTRLVPREMLRRHRIVLDAEVQAVLDASGFAYGDQWGSFRLNVLEKETKRWKKKRNKVILLPQAFGPFSDPSAKDTMRRILERVDLAFARDRESYQYLIELCGASACLKLSPDFTNLLPGRILEVPVIEGPYACVIPNCRMIDKASDAVRDSYMDFLKVCVEFLDERGENPLFLIHEGAKDYELALQVQSHLKRQIRLIREADPILVKSIVGGARVVVSSRFHGIVNALSQGVPCLASGWSHKYPMLMEDYGCLEYFISDLGNHDEVFHKLGLLVEDSPRTEIIDRILKGCARQKELAKAMWSEVHRVLEGCGHNLNVN
jgi:polysaccharide pyruvyl transferase WcaK-like protein